MADVKTADAPKKKRAAFTRTEKPIFALVTYTNEQGAAVKLDKSRLVITVERDMEKIVAAMEDGVGVATLMKLNMPKAATKPAAAEAPAA
jgi:hypothetical protein